MIIVFLKSNFDIAKSSVLDLKLVYLNSPYHHKPVHSRTQEERYRYGTHKIIRTKHGAHSLKIRSSNGNDTLSHR